MAAVIAKFHNRLLINWAATTADLANHERLPQVINTIGSSRLLVLIVWVTNMNSTMYITFSFGRALKELLLYFNWKRIAIIYSDDKTTRKCQSVVDGLSSYMAQSNIVSLAVADWVTAFNDYMAQLNIEWLRYHCGRWLYEDQLKRIQMSVCSSMHCQKEQEVYYQLLTDWH